MTERVFDHFAAGFFASPESDFVTSSIDPILPQAPMQIRFRRKNAESQLNKARRDSQVGESHR